MDLSINIFDSISITENKTIDGPFGVRYWVGGSGNWDASTTHWSETSGGAGGASVPSTSTDVFFDLHGNESTDEAYTVTVVTGGGICRNLDASFTGTTKVTLAGTSVLSIYGNLNLSGGVNQVLWTRTGSNTFMSSSNIHTINTNGVNMNCRLVINTGSTVKLLSDYLTSATNILENNGNFDANGKLFFATNYFNFSIRGSSVTTFYDLKIESTGTSYFCLSRIDLSTSLNVTNTLTINGSATGRILVNSSSLESIRTINCTGATTNFTNVDFKSISIVGGTIGINTNIGDCTRNSGITFSDPVDQHWINPNGGSLQNSSNWTSRIPLPQDNIFFDCAFGLNKVITFDSFYYRSGKNIDFTGATWTGTLTLNTGNNTTEIYGSLTLIDNLTLITGTAINFCFYSNEDIVLTTKNVDLKSISFKSYLTYGHTLFLGNNLNGTIKNSLLIYGGNFSCVKDGNNYNFSCSVFTVDNTLFASTLTFGTGTHSFLDDTKINFNILASTIITPFTGTLVFYGAQFGYMSTYNFFGKTYGNVLFERGTTSNNIIITGNNTFKSFKVNGTGVFSVNFKEGETNTFESFEVNGSATALKSINTDNSTARHYLVITGGGKVNCKYLNIQHSVATPSNTWYATDSINNQGVSQTGSGWNFIFSAMGNFFQFF